MRVLKRRIDRRRIFLYGAALLASCGLLVPLALFPEPNSTTNSATNAPAEPILSDRDRFHPVIARHGMVASQEALATRAGLAMLQAGGNAVDAAVTVAFALAVTLPRAGNLGGGGFMLVYDAETRKTTAIDFRERAPLAAHRDVFLDERGQVDENKKRASLWAVGVPGTVAGLALALEKFGTRELADTIAPAERLAREGFVVYPDLARSLARVRPEMSAFPASLRAYSGPTGSPLRAGETWKQPDLAVSLALIAREGPDWFYRGGIAERIVAYMRQAGGGITARDLAEYKAVLREPVKGTYRGYEIHSMPPPSSGGVHIVQILNILEKYPLRRSGLNSAASIHMMVEAMKRAYADRSLHLGDPDFVKVPVAPLTSKAYADSLRAQIHSERATPARKIAPAPARELSEGDETTHFSVVDRFGNAVALTYTLNFSYGMKAVVPGTGILLNNQMDDFSAKPGAANAYGLVGGEKNAVAPGKRMLSSMSPTILLRDGRPWLVTGSPGGSRIITTTLQIILNTIDHRMNIAAATNAPRVHHQWQPDYIRVERGLSPDTLRLLRERGHEVREEDAMGSTQSILIRDGRKTGASDPRIRGALTAGY